MSTVSTQIEPVVSAICTEPEGTVERFVYPMLLTPQNLKRFYDEASKFRTLFTDEINGDFGKFAECFISQAGESIYSNGLFWVVDDFVGMYYMTHIEAHDARVHYTFFDRRHLGREQLTRNMISYVFEKYKFRRLTTEIPMYASKHTFDFVLRLGFKKEGRIRKARLYKGDWFDTMILGILAEEGTNGSAVIS